MRILEFFGNSSKIYVNNHRHVAFKKVEPYFSTLMKDLKGYHISSDGTRDIDLNYFSNSNGKFTCFSTKEEFDYIKINDDYCDCPQDGSDEPKTNACNNGLFYCNKSSKKSLVTIPSYQVIDGVCDCCDGSDEWSKVLVLESNNCMKIFRSCLKISSYITCQSL